MAQIIPITALAARGEVNSRTRGLVAAQFYVNEFYESELHFLLKNRIENDFTSLIYVNDCPKQKYILFLPEIIEYLQTTLGYNVEVDDLDQLKDLTSINFMLRW